MNTPIYIDRPPRIQPESPVGEYDIPPPPDKQEHGFARLLQIGLPLVSVLGLLLSSAGGGGVRRIIPMMLAVVASVAYAAYSYRQEQRRRVEIEDAYADRLIELNKEMQNFHDMQRRCYRYNYPDPSSTFRIVRNARLEVESPQRTLRAEARLWERRVSDNDFGVVRLGVGTLPSSVTYGLRDVENFDDPQVRDAMKLDADSRYVPNIPVILSFRQPAEDEEQAEQDEDEDQQTAKEAAYTPPVTHALGIAGDRASAQEFTRALLAHYVVFHAPADARLYVLATEREPWRWAVALPHCKDDEHNKHLCFVSEIKGDQGDRTFDDDDGDELEQFLEGIRKILATRKIRLQEHEENQESGDATLPLLLVVVDLLDATYDPTSPLRKIESDAAISILLEEGAALGASVIFLVPERSKVPSGCQSVIEIEKTAPATNSRLEPHRKLHFRYAEIGLNSARYVGEADSISDLGAVDDLAQQLATLDVRQGFGANLATSVPFLDLMGYKSLQELSESAWNKWQASTQPQNANWLRVKLGLMSGNKSRTLVLSAKRDGVHGMVAGSTGSGKSELLISLICGLAVMYDPSVLNFVLVDYKGGGAFKPFETLPHVVDVITNLGEDAVTRMFTAIQAEMERRQRLNTDTNTKNIVDYRAKGLHQTHAPYPYLFIIIDEFAEMIASRAEFKAQLEMITRLGRAQGVSLILAAQRPSGVTDQMRSNIKFRICLRVETPGESREMLRRSDAAFLPAGVPGRGYLQVGNEDIELVQVAYTGDRIASQSPAQQAKVIWPDRGGSPELIQDQEPPELYVAIIDMLSEMAQQHQVRKQRAPWPNFLPTQLWLSRVLLAQTPQANAITFEEYIDRESIDKIMLGQPAETTIFLNPSVNKWLTRQCGWIERLDWTQYAMRPVIGLVDNPYAAKQLPLVINLPRGHVAIFGASGWGKTTFVRSLIVSLAATHSPDQFHAYLLDLGGRNLGVLAGLPHVGAVIIPDEEGYKERVEQLLRELDGIVEKRKTLLSNARVSDIYEYNRAHPDTPQAAILVAIDNFVEFIETFGGGNDDVETVLNRFVALARQSKPYGLHFAISVNQLGDLSNQLYSLFTERYALKLADPTEYRAIAGEQAPDPRDIPGRGYAKIERRALAFQVATLAKPAYELKRLEEFVNNINEHLQTARPYGRPVRVDALPKAVLLKQLIAREHKLALDERFLERLQTITRRSWQRSADPRQADWLKVTIGVAAGDRPRPLELEAKKDGVHGMIAGGTGAGKSELLMTLIVSLALNYDPSILNFVLVDYKGGGAFKPFETLPHVVDMITNLNKSAVRRVFTSINAEMQRRQKLNADTATKDIIEYRARGLHQTYAPYPHLFIIIDEYAEMITDSPEFRDELDSITRVGRAQGVNLLLASQRPVGVSDQMRANIKLRLCLRVEGVDTSREMLRRSDAAFLPNGMPGRGYLQVGNEHIELIQAAYTGETYDDAEAPEGGEKPRFYDVVVKLANELLQGERPRPPWPPFLPAALTFADPVQPRYLDQAYKPLITLGRTEQLQINPFVGAWLSGGAQWYGVDWAKTAMRAIVGLVDDPYNARQLPLIVDFTKGHAVLFGASGWGKTTFLRSLIVSLASTHSPDEFHAHVLDLGGRNLEVLQALPQVGTVILPDAPGYEERVQQLWRELNDLVDARKKLFSAAGVATLSEYNRLDGVAIEPAILVAINNFTEYVESFGNTSKQNDPDNLLEAFVALARQGKAYGLHFIISVNRLNVISSKLYSLFTERLTLRLSDAGEYSAIVGSQVSEIDEIAGRGATRVGRFPLSFQVALLPGAINEQAQVGGEAKIVQAIGARMKALISAAPERYREPLHIDALPKSSSYRTVLSEVFAISQDDKAFLSELQAAMAHTWELTASAQEAGWLEATLGVTSGNRLRTLAFEAKRDGAHGMIAGGTGSGKSELLMTLIVGLAVNFSPDILNFVLVDYKGGGAFKPFETLPHVVDTVTNLNKAAVDRMFTAINAEIRRRQALNAVTRTKDIIDYRRKGLHRTREPYPHLFIIIDEYSEMIDDNPEYRLALDSITRVGRAQGVNLILASQQPKGVSDQMRANIKLRMCLKVEQIETSRELLRRPDAAFLPNGMPGRGYIQAGSEQIELIQVAYTGEFQPDDRAAAALWPDRPHSEALPAAEETPRLFDAIVRLASELVDGRMARKPWPSFLPEQFSLETRLVDAKRSRRFQLEPALTDWCIGDSAAGWPALRWRNDVLRPVVGLLDNPAEAEQIPLRLDLSRNHLAVFGDTGLGKTTFLRTLLVSLAATHAPNDLHLYVIDLGGRNFRSIEELPHVGTVIYADEEAFEERLQRLLEKLDQLTEERQQQLSNADATSVYEFNERFPDQAIPPIVVAIDNIAGLQEAFEALVETTLTPLVRRSLGVGITFAVTGNVPTNMPSKLYNLFSERLTFKQSNPDRYMDIVGRGAIDFGDVPGRGYIRRSQTPLMFHIAQPVGIVGKDGRAIRPEAAELRLIAGHMQAHLAANGGWRTRPDRISALPVTLLLADMLKQAPASQPRLIAAVLGEDSTLQPALFDLKQMGPHFTIVGPPLAGKTTALYSWALSLAARYTPQQVKLVLIDTQRRLFEYGGARKLSDLPHVIAAVAEVEQLADLTDQLLTEGRILAAQKTGASVADGQRLTVKKTGPAIFVIIDNFDDFSEEVESNRKLARDLSSLARRYGGYGIHFVISGALDGPATELRRRIQGANYGIGLRSAQAVEALRVQRTPAALRGKEFPVGRGYIVKSGQATMIQIAAPYDSRAASKTRGAPDDEDNGIAQALDSWVERIQAMYPGQRASWLSGNGHAPASQALSPQQSAKLQRMSALLQAGLRKEITYLKSGQANGDLLTDQLLHLDIASWNNEGVVLRLLKELWLKEQVASGMARDAAETMLTILDEESMLLGLESALADGDAAAASKA